MFGRIHQWGHRVLGCNAFEYWFSVFTKVCFFTSVSTAADLLLTSPRVSSTSHVTKTYFIPLGLLSLPNSMGNPCHRVLHLPSKSSKLQQLATLASVREEMGKRWEEVAFFSWIVPRKRFSMVFVQRLVELHLWSWLWTPLWGSL